MFGKIDEFGIKMIIRHPIGMFVGTMFISIATITLSFFLGATFTRGGSDLLGIVFFLMGVINAYQAGEIIKYAWPTVKFELNKKNMDVFELTFFSKENKAEFKLTQYGKSEQEVIDFWTKEMKEKIQDNYEYRGIRKLTPEERKKVK